MTQEQYNKVFCQPSDVSRFKILKDLIEDSRIKGKGFSKFTKMKRKQLCAIYNKQMSVDEEVAGAPRYWVDNNGEKHYV